MNFVAKTCKWIQQVAWALVKHFQQTTCPSSQDPDEMPLVIAVTSRYPTRVVLYAAAFQGGWKVCFVKSLREAVAAAQACRPKAVFYDHAAGDATWDRRCSSLSRAGIPFVFLARKSDDTTFLTVLAAGGYQALGDPLTSEVVVKAVHFADEVAGLARVAVT